MNAGPPSPPSTRRQTLTNVIGVLLFMALYLALDPWSTHFHSTTAEHLLVAERCVTAGDCPVLGLTVSETPVHMGPLVFYLLMPAAPFGYLAAWQVLLGVLAMLACMVLLVREGDHLFAFPVGLLAVPLWLAFEGSEFLVDLRHAPLAAPFVVGALFTLSRFARGPSVGGWIAFCLLFWTGMQLQFSMYVLALPALWLGARVTRGGHRWALIGAFVAVGAASQLPAWIHYASEGFEVFGNTLRIASESPVDWSLARSFLVPMAVALVALEVWVLVRPDGATRDPVFGLPFVALMLLGYLPLIGMAQPRYLFPIAAVAAVRFSCHLVRVARGLPARVRRRDPWVLLAPAPFLLVAVAVTPHVIGAIRTDQSLTPCDTLRGQAEIVDGVMARAGDPWEATPQVHGPLSVEVSQQLEYLLHERRRRAGQEPRWSLDAPAIAVDRTGAGCGAGALSLVEYEPCLRYGDAEVEVSLSWKTAGRRSGLRLPLGAKGGAHFTKGQRTPEGAATASFLSARFAEKDTGERMILRLSIPFHTTGACREALATRALRVLVDPCATILADACTPAAGCVRDRQGVHEMHFGDHEPELRVRRLTVPADALLGEDALRIRLNLTSCDRGLRLLDVHEVPIP